MKQKNWRQRVLFFFAVAILVVPGTAMSESEQFLSYYLYDDFRRHPASKIYAGPPAPVILETDALAKQFRTRLTEGAKSGPNFAGAYTIVEWGCGTNCQQIAIINARTGRVSDWLTTELGSNYQIDSMLFIENPVTEECSSLEWCKTKYYRLEKGKLVSLK